MRRALLFSVLLACGPRPATNVPEAAPVQAAPVTDTPAPEAVAAVEFVIEDAFPISGRGPVATGKLTGRVEVGDALMIEDSAPPLVVKVLAVEEFATPGGGGNDVGLLLQLPADADIGVLARGTVLVRAAARP